MKIRYLALAALLAPALPAQAQTGVEAFNPLAMLAPILTPFGMMLAPMMPATTGGMNPFNPATLFNPAAFMNPAAMQNPMAMLPSMPTVQPMPAYGVPNMMSFPGMPPSNPFALPQQFPNPFAASLPTLPFALPAAPAQGGFAFPPGLPMLLPAR